MPHLTKLPRWCLIVFLLFLLCASYAFLIIHDEMKRRTPFWHKYQNAQLGMTEEEVKDIFGQSADEESIGSLGPTALTWVDGDQRITVFFLSERRGEIAIKRVFLPKSLPEKLRDPFNSSTVVYP